MIEIMIVKLGTIGLDIAKYTFHLFSVNKMGRLIKKKQLKRKQVLAYFAKLEPCLIAMEACGGANYWARELIALGHEVKLIAPQYVKPFVKGNKNDFNDAEGITEAAHDQICDLCRSDALSNKIFRIFTANVSV
ncbi:IS110 family transposase [Psychrobium sp. nBUS_13]|uniref:IS110 family transposase n=1 Tax=Psychrobium sp. nBUS_13 TaxID=3395319 RepID=UPI003EBE73E5